MQQSRTGARRGASAALRAFLQQSCMRLKGHALARPMRGAATPAAADAQSNAATISSLANTRLKSFSISREEITPRRVFRASP